MKSVTAIVDNNQNRK